MNSVHQFFKIRAGTIDKSSKSVAGKPYVGETSKPDEFSESEETDLKELAASSSANSNQKENVNQNVDDDTQSKPNLNDEGLLGFSNTSESTTTPKPNKASSVSVAHTLIISVLFFACSFL